MFNASFTMSAEKLQPSSFVLQYTEKHAERQTDCYIQTKVGYRHAVRE